MTGALGKGELDEIINAVAQGNVPGFWSSWMLFAGSDPTGALAQLADHVRELIFVRVRIERRNVLCRFLRGLPLQRGDEGELRPDLLLELALLRLTGAAVPGEGSLQKGAVSTLEKVHHKRSKQAAGQTVREQAASAHPSRQGYYSECCPGSTQRQTAVQKNQRRKLRYHPGKGSIAAAEGRNQKQKKHRHPGESVADTAKAEF